ncbi:MAG TPA: DUF4159 domain-containing protein, partial [Armatimonadota bacterium]|nr:DUF4159 domain-containing protein [Armatimonadota bacterium]
MTAITLMTVCCGTVLGLAVLALLVMQLVSLYRRNRLLIAAITAALALHLAVGGACWLARGTPRVLSDGPVVHIAPKQTPPPLEMKPIIPELPTIPTLPKGKWDGDRHARRNPRGDDPNKKPGDPTPKTPLQPLPAEPPNPKPPIFTPTDDPERATFFTPERSSLSPEEVRNMRDGTTRGHGRGPRGEGGGDPNGDPNSPGWRRGDPHGTEQGRVYFIRLKHGSGAWNAHAAGISRLLAFLNGYFPCETESRAMTAAEVAERFLTPGTPPAFLYLYCDETFALAPRETAVLRAYLDGGGFLFLDSRPDPVIRDDVGRELAKVLPGSRLAPVAKHHPINTFLFRLGAPGVGLNVIEKTNYGITHNGRLTVFYTLGNFAQLYASFPPTADAYVKAQYQMGANVMLYAIRQGNAADIRREAGASARV